MDNATVFLILCFIWTSIQVLVTRSLHRKSGTDRLPPGPYPFPIIGSIFKLGNKPHQSLAILSKTYGPLMSLKLGNTTAIVVSSPKIAKELLLKHDHTVSSRSIPDVARVLDHDKVSVAWSPVGTQWRKLRRICKEQLFSLQQLDASQDLRRKKIQELVDYAHHCCINGESVNIGRTAFTTSVNSISNLFFSTDLDHYHSLSSSQQFKDIIWGLLELAGKPNIADYFPVLKLVDPQGARRKVNFYFEKLFVEFDRIVDQRLQARTSSADIYSTNNDVLDSLLDIIQKNDTELSRNDMIHLLLDLFVAGTDTTSSTVEWAMAELIRNPEKMAKARFELEEVIGKVGLLQESDISRLPYLQAVVKETLRLHPPVPFLVPHKAEADVEVEGFVVPKDAQILFNVWATGRDSSVWLNPKSFMPERILDCDIDYRGRHFELIPFGAGRRICPGLPLAYRMVHLMLGSLLYNFNWKLEEGMKAEDMDMSEKFGLTLQKAEPLKAIPIKGVK